MVTLVHDCPHCGAEKVGFTFRGEQAYPDTNNSLWNVFFSCNACLKPLAVIVFSPHARIPSQMNGDMTLTANCREFYPQPKAPSHPDHCPAGIARAFLQAEKAISLQHWESAGAMDRRAMELATKEKAPESANLTLYRRIEKLAQDGKLTPSLAEWAHSLRIVGNDALHEIEGLTEEESVQAHELTRFILTYLYTLPTQVAQARVIRDEDKNAHPATS